MIKAKLTVPGGTSFHDSGGEKLVSTPFTILAYCGGMGCPFWKALLVRLKPDGRVLSSNASTVGRMRSGRDGFLFGGLPREKFRRRGIEKEALSLRHRLPSMDSSFW
jgi:hypothetical protein